MDINLIKLKAFELAAAYQLGDPEQKKEVRRRIKGLSQERRTLLIQILNNPDVKIDDERLKSLDRRLTHAYTRYTDPACKISRAWKNRWGGRIKSTAVLQEMAVARADYEAKLNKVHKPSENVEKKLEFFVTEPFAVEVLNHFLRKNRKALTSFAFENPDKWRVAIKKIHDKLIEIGDKKAYKLIFLLANLDRKINLFQIGSLNLQESGVPKDILNEIASWLPAAESSILTMQILYGGLKAKKEAVLGAIDPQAFASWMKTHNLKLHAIGLPFEDIKKIAPYFDEIDLTHLGLGVYDRKITSFSVKKPLLAEHIPWISLFQEVKELTFHQPPLSQHLTELLKNMKKVTDLSFFLWSSSVVFTEDPCYLQIKSLHFFDNVSVKGIEHLKNLKKLSISDGASWTHMGELPKLDHLTFRSSEFSPKQLLILKNIENLTLNGNLDAAAMEVLGSLPNLKHLELEGSNQSETLSFLKNINSLSLTHDVTDSSIKALQTLPNLKHLALGSLRTKEGWKALVHLESLEIRWAYRLDAANLKYLENLKELKLGSYFSIEELKNLAILPQLRVLYLGSIFVSREQELFDSCLKLETIHCPSQIWQRKVD